MTYDGVEQVYAAIRQTGRPLDAAALNAGRGIGGDFTTQTAEMEDTKVGAGTKDDPAVVAKQGFEALMDGDQKVLGGSLKTRAHAIASKVLPDSVKAQMHRSMAEPGSADS